MNQYPTDPIHPNLFQILHNRARVVPLPEWPNVWATSWGTVVSTRTANGRKGAKHRIHVYTPTPHYRSGHLRIRLQTNQGGGGKWFRPYLHRLVCTAFHGPPPTPDAEVLHNSPDPHDNRPENLRWGTRSENAQQREQDRRARAVDLEAGGVSMDPWG